MAAVTPETVQTLCEQLRADLEHPWCSDLMRDAADLLESLLGEVERLRQENVKLADKNQILEGHFLTMHRSFSELADAYYLLAAESDRLLDVQRTAPETEER